MAKPRIAQAARTDFREIRSYSKTAFGAEKAREYIEALRATFHLLGDRPFTGRRESDLGDGIRSFPCRLHRIYDRSDDGLVTIVRILHQVQDVAKALGPSQ